MSLPRLRAPDSNRSVLAVPPLADLGRTLEANRTLFAKAQPDLDGASYLEVRRRAIQEAKTAAAQFLQELGVVPPVCPSESLIVTGHQPELFHPGVWIKNFAVAGLARTHGLTPLNLIIDNDAAKT